MKSVSEIIDSYVLAAVSHGEETEKGNNKVVNKQYQKLASIYKKMEKNSEIAEDILKILLFHQNDYVKLWAASHSLGLNLYVQNAIEILETISQKSGFLGFNAKMTLEIWQEKKKLVF